MKTRNRSGSGGATPQDGPTQIGESVFAMPTEVSTVNQDCPLRVVLREERRPLPLEAEMHGCFELGVLTSGCQEWHTADSMTVMHAGDVYLTASWEPHGWRVLEPWTRTVQFAFMPEILGDELVGSHPWQHIFAVHPDERPRVSGSRMAHGVLAVAREIETEIREQLPSWLQMARLSLWRILIILAREWQLPIRHEDRRRTRGADLERIMPAFDLVRTSPGHRVSREDAARGCALSGAQFGVIFRRAMGVTFGQYALGARLARAAYLLRLTNLSVEAIADHCGFVDGSHLSRIFTEHYRLKPLDYRRQGNEPHGTDNGAWRSRLTARRGRR